MQQITLDLIPNGSMPVVNASQYDDGRVFRVNITENGTPYVLTDEVIEIHVRKGDGCAVTALVAYTANKSYLDIATTEQMTAVAGNNIAEINVKKNGSDIGSLNFILLVERDPLDAGVESESGIYDLQAQVNRCVQNSFDTLGAAGLPYDNTESGLEATNVQTAIDEVNAKIAEGPSDVYTKEETDALLENKADKTSVYTKTEADALLADKVSTSTLESDYYTKTETDTKLDGKANKSTVYTKTQTDALLDDKVDNSTLEDYYSSSEVDALLYQKANKNSVYTKAEINTQMAGKANVSDLANYYTKSETYSKSQTDDALALKADSADVYDKTYMDGIFEEIDNAFTGVNTALGTKADKSTTYTKTETDNALSLKADKSDTYTKAQVDTALSGKVDNATLANYYTKNEVDAKIYDVYPSIDVSSAPIASFETDIVLPLKSCKANIVPTGGNGTPDSPIPINGYTEANIVNTQNESIVDLFSIDSDFRGTVAFNQLVNSEKFISVTTANYTFTPNNDGSITVEILNTLASATNAYLTANTGTSYFKVPNGHKFAIYDTKCELTTLEYRNGYTGTSLGWNTVKIGSGSILLGVTLPQGLTAQTFTLNPQIVDFTQMFGSTIADYIYTLEQATPGAGVAFFRSIYPANYYAYDSGTNELVGKETPEATIAFGQTVYGGVFDVTRGNLTVTHANIASYNGESINEPWLSSKDVYTPGGTPTTGAQVVYPLATPFDIDLTPVQINALLGVNNVYNDVNGDTEVTFRETVQKYVDDKISEL